MPAFFLYNFFRQFVRQFDFFCLYILVDGTLSITKAEAFYEP